MEFKTAQVKLVEAIQADAEKVIAKAIEFRADTADIVAEVRKAPGTVQGVAASAVKYALRGATDEESRANIIKFVGSL